MAAQAFNSRHNITGELLYGGGRFLQLLEGDAQAVEHLYDNKIAKDPRHTGCTVLHQSPCDMRLLPNWSMGRLYLQEVEGAPQLAWDALCVEIARQNPAAIFARKPVVSIINALVEHFGVDVDRILQKFIDESRCQADVCVEASGTRASPAERALRAG